MVDSDLLIINKEGKELNRNRKSAKPVATNVNVAGDMMKSPCTITECVQIARGVAEDAIADYHQNQGNVQLSMSIQIEILKELIFSSGMITEEEFRQKYMEKAQELQKIQSERIAQIQREAKEKRPDVSASMTGEVGDIEVKVEE